MKYQLDSILNLHLTSDYKVVLRKTKIKSCNIYLFPKIIFIIQGSD